MRRSLCNRFVVAKCAVAAVMVSLLVALTSCGGGGDRSPLPSSGLSLPLLQSGNQVTELLGASQGSNAGEIQVEISEIEIPDTPRARRYLLRKITYSLNVDGQTQTIVKREIIWQDSNGSIYLVGKVAEDGRYILLPEPVEILRSPLADGQSLSYSARYPDGETENGFYTVRRFGPYFQLWRVRRWGIIQQGAPGQSGSGQLIEVWGTFLIDPQSETTETNEVIQRFNTYGVREWATYYRWGGGRYFFY